MRARLALGVLLAAVAQLAATGLLLTSAWLIVRAAQQPPVLYLMIAIVGVRFFGVGRAAARYAERLLTHDVALETAIRTRVAVYAAVARLAPHGLAGRRHGEVVQQAVEDVDTVQDRLLRIRLPWWSALTTVVVLTVVVGLVDPAAGGVLAAQAGLTLLVLRLAVPRWSGRSVASSLAPDVTEAARNAAELVALGAADEAVERARSEIARSAAADRRQAHAGGGGSAVVLALTAAGLGGVALVLAPAMASGGIAPLLVGVVLLAPLALAEALDPVADAERRRPVVEAAERRVRDLVDAAPAVSAPVVPAPVPDDPTIAVDDVTVGWDTDLTRPLSFVLRPGEVVGVGGPSGSGKSTLALTLARLVAPRHGVVRLGGTDLAELRAEDVRAVVGVLGQDEAVFDTTVRENLRIARPDADDDRLHEAMCRVGLHLDLDRTAGEQGDRLSGGERQRLALARLLLGGHRVLVLDEPTEHLDGPLARALVDDVLTLAPEHTVVLISHDPAVLSRCDRVVAVERRDARSPAVA
ncbi:thiol reductant ABC exporter subunit CydC [Aeromicrobium sp. Leaf350]|uniref:thiol reductant ABC exporter subunit CydC n=1 Tax=Aeromicrobium sp. Leaf350 TaxID=2876565 RepID=UPI001E48B512|nr:thiol reductant ABC exporter subunit CydC [Aeromicrobium sp. Leaf350]